jgi:arsenate reductase
MEELGIDISAHTSKTVERYVGQPWDFLIPVCEEACEVCPYVPGARRVERWAFDDPAAVNGDDAARLEAFRRVRDEIAAAVRDFIGRTVATPSGAASA